MLVEMPLPHCIRSRKEERKVRAPQDGEVQAGECQREPATDINPPSGVDRVLRRATISAASTRRCKQQASFRSRWLNKEEALRLLDVLLTHQRQLTRFALATALRQANVLGLQWSSVAMERRTAWVHADEAKVARRSVCRCSCVAATPSTTERWR